MILRVISIMFFILCFSLWATAQQPAHTVLGEAELSNINIYDLTQDEQRNYWLATDHGIIKYDGYRFHFIESSSMMGTSVFALTFDAHNDLYCNNLSGQIFKIKDNKCTVHFQIPDSLMSNEIYFQFDEENNLVIATNALFKVDPLGKIEMLHHPEGAYNRFYYLFQKKDKSLITSTFSPNNLIEIKHGALSLRHLGYSSPKEASLQFMYLGDSLYYYDKKSSRLLDLSSSVHSFLPTFIPNKKDGPYRFYSNNKILFVALPTGGMLLYNDQFKPLLDGRLIFESEIISSFHQDLEGNLLFGTFKGGVITIPNIHLTNIGTVPQNARFTHLEAVDETIFAGTQDGRVFKISNHYEVSEFRKTQVKSIEGLKYIQPTGELLIDEMFPLLVNLKSGKEQKLSIGAIKDIESINDSAYLIATNAGVYSYNPLRLEILAGQRIRAHHNSPNTYLLENFQARTNAVNYDLKNNIIYAGTSQGLKIGQQNSLEYFTLNEVPIICLDIQYSGAKIYIATQNEGLLVFDNGKLSEQWTTHTGLVSNTINQIKIYGNRIYLSTSNGFQVLSMVGEGLYSLKPSDGLHNISVIDFEISKNTLWLVQQKGIQKINLDHIQSSLLKPQIRIERIIQGSDTLHMQSKDTFNHDQSKFEFHISSSTIKYQNELEYKYQLLGLDEQWQVNSYVNNKIVYLSLPPGSYTFSVKAVCRNQESETLSYSFTIAPPYWNTWWFYMLSVLLVLLASGGVFASFYIRQKRKIQFQNELNNSKLTAIQSQMNPHFIFNALNSIQDFIVLNEKKMAGRYLGKFADLMRIYLNHSQVKTVTIKEEVEALKLYLELEKLRFDTLEFGIYLDEEIDENLISIPALLVQPYVENALKHGLLHRREGKELFISFRLVKEHDLIECEIVDNGIGRVASAEVNKMRNPNHESFATKATKKRLEMLNYGHKKPIGENVIDLYNEEGRATGTRVVLRIPILE